MRKNVLLGLVCLMLVVGFGVGVFVQANVFMDMSDHDSMMQFCIEHAFGPGAYVCKNVTVLGGARTVCTLVK